MKKLSKKPTPHLEPDYPSLRSNTFDRRKFLSLLGGGAAASALIPGCYRAGDGEIEADADLGTTNREDFETESSGEESTGIQDTGTADVSTEEDVEPDTETLRGPEDTDTFVRRLPRAGYQMLYLPDGSSVSYAIVVGFEEPLFAKMPENELLAAVDEKLVENFDVYDFESESVLGRIEEAARQAMVKTFESRHGVEAALNRVEFIIERVLRPNDPIGIIKTRMTF